MLRAVGIAAAGLLAAATGARAEPSAAMDASPPPPLAPQMQHGVEFVTGGVGDAEQTELFAEPARDYNVRITLTDPGGAYLSDVHVRIADADGNTKLDTPYSSVSGAASAWASSQPGSSAEASGS